MTWWEERTARVNEAADIVSAQKQCSQREAMVLLRERAAETDSDLEDTALAVVGRRISFSEKNSHSYV